MGKGDRVREITDEALLSGEWRGKREEGYDGTMYIYIYIGSILFMFGIGLESSLEI